MQKNAHYLMNFAHLILNLALFKSKFIRNLCYRICNIYLYDFQFLLTGSQRAKSRSHTRKLLRGASGREAPRAPGPPRREQAQARAASKTLASEYPQKFEGQKLKKNK